jgi:hypothetical protein
MDRSLFLLRVLFFGIVLPLPSGFAVGQTRLLAELRTQGFCFDCQPGQMMYGIGFGIRGNPKSLIGWSLSAGISDIGRELAAPSDLLPQFNNVLTHNSSVDGSMGCCNGDVGDMNSGGLTNGTQQDKVMITRFVPPLGFNFFRYQITDLTMTVDRLEWLPVSSSQFRGETAYTARVYGIPEPSALAEAMGALAFIALRVRLSRR